ncbi:MAG TPA: ABC transporter substrate-binding protein [Saprospiraceae bacterium]|nr:ABC transporter substrate-binding protein [Saprospiraceae bacterium]
MKFSLFLLSISTLFLLNCTQTKSSKDLNTDRIIVDVFGRKIIIADTINKVITMRSGAVRMMAYMGLIDKVGYIEGNDLKRIVPYIMAYPELKELPVIGIGNNYDPEAIAASSASMIVATNITAEEADALQVKVGKPVFCIKNGDLDSYKLDFYDSLKSLGEAFNKSSRADSIINFIEININEIKSYVPKDKKTNTTVYVGGIAYNGVQGITSTRTIYPPFTYLNVFAPADTLTQNLDSMGIGQKNLMIDTEQIIDWDVDYLFLDVAGQPLWNLELSKTYFNNLKSKKNGNIYTVLPFNWNSVNYENILCNMWFVGKTVYPTSFESTHLTHKNREIINFFYGRDIYDQVMDTRIYTNNNNGNEIPNILYKPYEKVTINVR